MKTTKLEKLNACKDAIEWAANQKNYKEAWQSCERGDWMLWLAFKLNIDDKKLTMAKVMCVKQVEHLMRDQRSRDALQSCIDYANGKITRNQLNAAAYAAAAAYDAAAAYAAYAATAAAYDAAAAYAAYAAAADDAAAAADATYAVKKETLKQCASIVRKHYPKAPRLR